MSFRAIGLVKARNLPLNRDYNIELKISRRETTHDVEMTIHSYIKNEPDQMNEHLKPGTAEVVIM